MRTFYRLRVAIEATVTGVVEVEANSVAGATGLLLADFDGVCRENTLPDSVKLAITNRRVIQVDPAPTVEPEEGDES